MVVAGQWELGWNTPIKEVELWQFMLRDFGVAQFYMFPVSGIASNQVKERSSLEDIIKEFSDHIPVFIDERGEIDLEDFVHPENALYITGIANDKSLPEEYKSIKIRTVANKGLLWSHQALSIVLYDKLIKDGISSN